MKIKCPKCKQEIPAEQINVSTDLALCADCNEGFKVSESLDHDAVNTDVLRNPPKGAWINNEVGTVIVGATTRSPIAFFLVPFMCIWSGGAIGGIYVSQIISGKFDLVQSLFGIPFLIGTILFGAIALMTVCGKVEVTIGRNSSVFIGIGSLGWRRHFDWLAIHSIREEATNVQYPGSKGGAIVLEGSRRLKFGTGLNEERRYFILSALKYLKAQNS